ncbi:UNVERIFIED_CONTAM: histidine kinase, partial [Bacillus sp. ATCC 13368]
MVALSRPIDVQRIRTLLAGNHVHFDDWENNQLVVPTPNAIYLWDATYPNVLIMRGIWRGIARNDAQF